MQGAEGDDRVPRLVPGWEQKATELSPEEGFVISRIDGVTPWGVLRRIGGLPPVQLDEWLERWIADGLVSVPSARRARRRTPAAPPPPRTVVPDVRSAPAQVDPGLDIPVELQERILAFESELEAPYHQILGVARDADERTIKRAYFRLSKDFHPDRYFRKNVGEFEERLDRIFKKVALAYELLMDPATRAEVERSLQSAPSAPPREPGAPAPAAPQPHSKREWLARMHRRFRIPEKILTERRFKARNFADAGMVAKHQQKWKEAASCIRLAIAFDPWNDEYKESFAEIQAEVNQLRADEILAAAADALGSRSAGEALRLYEEVITYRPADPAVHARAAEAAVEVGDLERAREYAERAVELDPEVADVYVVLARVLRREGLRERATAALQTARKLDPRDRRIYEEFALLRPRPRHGSGGTR